MTAFVLMSDLHREVSLFSPPPSVQKADVVVLAGDIDVGLKGVEWAALLGKPVVYVPGNHEYKGHDVLDLDLQFRAFELEHPHVHILQERQVIIEGVRFLGCTLWTDFEFSGLRYKNWSLNNAQREMPEYSKTRLGTRSLSAHDTLAWHQQQKQWLASMLSIPFDGPTVVVTHHAPHANSVAPWRMKDELAGAFASNLDTLLGSPIVWCHGHTHERVDYWVGDTRVLSCPRGYYRECNARPKSWSDDLLFEAHNKRVSKKYQTHFVAGTFSNPR